MKLIDVSEAAQNLMHSLGLVGSYDVRCNGSRATGWVGKPGEGDDVALVLTITPLTPIKAEEPNPVRG